jgi:hypothetical protein
MRRAVLSSGFFAATLNPLRPQVWLKGKSISISAVILSAAHLGQALGVSGLGVGTGTRHAWYWHGHGTTCVENTIPRVIQRNGCCIWVVGNHQSNGHAIGVAAVGMVFFAVSGEIATPTPISQAFAWSLVYLLVMTTITAVLMVASGRTDLKMANKDR